MVMLNGGAQLLNVSQSWYCLVDPIGGPEVTAPSAWWPSNQVVALPVVGIVPPPTWLSTQLPTVDGQPDGSVNVESYCSCGLAAHVVCVLGNEHATDGPYALALA